MRNLATQIGLAAFLSGFFCAFVEAHATPAPLFDPILDDIRQRLPERLQFRLPAVVPLEGEFYPFISKSYGTELIVGLGTTPDCDSIFRGCHIVEIRATTKDTMALSWSSHIDYTIVSVALNEDIEGSYIVLGGERVISQTLIWNQDETTYRISTGRNALSQDEFIAIARSMVNQPPISR